jgi:hypothetical protein
MSESRLEPVRFGDFLIEKKAIDEGQLLDALADHWISGCPLGEAVAKKGYLASEEIARLLKEFESLSTVWV